MNVDDDAPFPDLASYYDTAPRFRNSIPKCVDTNRELLHRMLKSKLLNGSVIITFGLLLLLLAAILGSSQPALAQTTYAMSSSAANENDDIPSDVQDNNSSEAQQLPGEEGFSMRLLAMNLSAPHNILYGPDSVLWIRVRRKEHYAH